MKLFFDIVIVGSSPLGILESIYHSNKGLKVLIIDNSIKIGGAWKSISFTGIENVENAIHYLLPSETAFKFLDVNLKLELEEIEGKVTLYRFLGIFNFFLNYDGYLSNIISFFLNKDFKNFKKIFKKKKSIYFKYGTPSMINCLEKKLNESNVEVLLNKEITKINFDKKISLITKSGEIIKANKIVCTNSSRLNNIFKGKEKIQVIEKIQKRPSIHLVLDDESKSNKSQIIYFNNPVIKYVHEITKYSTGEISGKRIFVVALKHELTETKEIFEQVHQILKESNLCSNNSKILYKKWTNVVLPRLFNEDLYELKARLGEQFLFLKTESLTHSIEENYKKWITI